VVPDRCTIDLDRRLLPGETWASVRGVGPGQIEQDHTETEYVDVRQIVQAGSIYPELMVEV
jgi:acetylornithine deacetylase/succinyl-diaminopimelate desuccinylase-like protein